MPNYSTTYVFDDKKIQELLPEYQQEGDPGDGDFSLIGKHFCGLFIDSGLKPEHSVLDVGCSVGHNAIPLTQYLKGKYEGFDVVKPSVDIANNLLSKFKNFNFKHADIYNGAYNPTGKINPLEFKFPYENNSFNFVHLISVFTHMLSDDVEHYLDEIKRVLKKDGVAFISYFILGDTEEKDAYPDRQLEIAVGNGFAQSNVAPEGAMGYHIDYLKGLYDKKGFKDFQVKYGWWAGRKKYTSYQDIIIARK